MKLNPRYAGLNPITLLFLSTLLCLIGFRLVVLKEFGYKYIDSDQAVLWHGLKDYAQCIFHEPRFYGQDYNSMLESLLAMPLYRIGLPIENALPLITNLLALAPFITIAVFTFVKKSKLTAIIVAGIPLLLSSEYDMISSLPRGFVTGIAASSITIASLYFPASLRAAFAAGISGMVALSLNPNAFFVVYFCFAVWFLLHRRNRKFYIYFGAGILAGVVIHCLITAFYWLHPAYAVHRLDMYSSVELFSKGMSHLDHFLNKVTPLFWNKGWIYLPAFIGLGIYYFRNNNKAFALAAILIPLLIILPLALQKVHDGTNSVFFSYARMYLALPVLLALMLSFIHFKGHLLTYLWCLVPIIFMFSKILIFEERVSKNLKAAHVVAVRSTKTVLGSCNIIKDFVDKYNVTLIINGEHHMGDFVNYACPAVKDSFPVTIKPGYERRTWVLEEVRGKVYSNILILDHGRNIEALYSSAINIDDGSYLIQGNKLMTTELLEKLEIPVRQY